MPARLGWQGAGDPPLGANSSCMRSLLENELLSVRLYAARQAESSAELRSSRLPRVVLWWALARTGFTGEPGPRWLVRRRMVQRRRKLTREECLASFRRVEHPLACLAHAMRLVELHGQDAIPALLEVLPQVARSEAHAEAVAWALGTLGRTILAETLAAARKASPAVRHWLLLALWFLGPEAHGVEKDLLGWAEPMAEAVLLNLESRAAAQAARDGRVEVVYLDDAAVYELAEQIYGLDNLARRRRAVRALRGFGPAQEAAVKLLAACLDDPDLSTTAARTLVEYHPEEALRPLLRDESFFPFIAQLPDVQKRLSSVMSEEEFSLKVARAACELVEDDDSVSRLISVTRGATRWHLLRLSKLSTFTLEVLEMCATDEHPGVRLLAAAGLRSRLEGVDCLKRLTLDPDLDVAVEAVAALLELYPDDEALALDYLMDKWMRRRVLERLKDVTPAVQGALGKCRLSAEERHDLPCEVQLNTYTDEELEALLREGNLQRLTVVANAGRLFEIMAFRLDGLPEALVADVLESVGPRLLDRSALRPFACHPSEVIRAALERL